MDLIHENSPACNGLAEQAVQTFKTAMKRMQQGSVESKVSHFCSSKESHHIVATIGVSPAELMFSRPLHIHFNLLYPKVQDKVIHNHMKQKQYHDTHCKRCQFKEGLQYM